MLKVLDIESIRFCSNMVYIDDDNQPISGMLTRNFLMTEQFSADQYIGGSEEELGE